jgi:hypothetical protein
MQWAGFGLLKRMIYKRQIKNKKRLDLYSFYVVYSDIMKKLELNKTYEFDLGDMSHCGKSHEDMIKYYNGNSSPLSFFVEQMKLPEWFDNIVYDTSAAVIWENGHKITIKPDLRDKETRTILMDQKAYNLKGGDFTRSSMKGAGRKVHKEKWVAWVKAQTFIWTDFTELPKVRVIALLGEECLTRFPNGKIGKKAKELLFG